jgi:hypothetical protein
MKRGTSMSPNSNNRLVGRRTVLSLAGAAALSCSYPIVSLDPARGAKPPRKPAMVILVAIDGARWQDIYYGPSEKGAAVARSRDELIPHMMAMEKAGVTWGAPDTSEFHASGPNFISLPGYMEMLSGTSNVACTENDCQVMRRRTLLDDFQERAPGDPTRVGAFSSWPNVGVAASVQSSGTVSTGRWGGARHHLFEKFPRCSEALLAGRSDQGGVGAFRHDAMTARLARAFIAEAEPAFTFISLGETDEEAHRGNYHGYLRALQSADEFVGQLRADLERFREQGGETLLVVTTDHGRAHNFNDHGRGHSESSRAFLFAEGSRIRNLSSVRAGRAYLRDIAPTIRAVSDLPGRNDAGSGRVLEEIII